MSTSGRAYESPLRREQALATERRILDAAYRLLVDQGYGATTMSAVAREAGVSTPTVYKVVGSKPELVKRVYDVTLVGDAEPVPFAERPEVRAAYEEADPRRFLAAYAGLGRLLLDRLGPLLATLVAGARSGEPELVEFVATINGERLAGTTMVARRLEEMGALRPGLDVERARDLIWTLNSIEVWELLVRQRGWSPDEWEAWQARALVEAVLAGE
jgi:AcrR family transcriptional regulator